MIKEDPNWTLLERLELDPVIAPGADLSQVTLGQVAATVPTMLDVLEEGTDPTEMLEDLEVIHPVATTPMELEAGINTHTLFRLRRKCSVLGTRPGGQSLNPS